MSDCGCKIVDGQSVLGNGGMYLGEPSIEYCPLHASAAKMLDSLMVLNLNMPLVNSWCHFGVCEQSECSNCKRIKNGLDAIKAAEGR